MTGKNVLIIIAVIIIILGAGWWYTNNAGDEGNVDQTATPTTHVINMDMMMYEEEGGFSEPAITIKKGDSITWKNMGSMAHTITSDGGVFDSGNVDVGGMFTYTFDEAGEFPYNCTYHKMMGMVGSVVVQ
ncbi:hypothetical protein CL630_02815 [bacterium]|nr:hypothetical protein [bacterium]|tara:strand:- start:3300 stop:3689 length:390 start_codon:yes stop_codon:yes gene_type:complete